MLNKTIGFNTAVIKHNDNFLALALKIKKQDETSQIYYLQSKILSELLVILQSRMLYVAQCLKKYGDSYKYELKDYAKDVMSNTPYIDTTEVQDPVPERRIMSLAFKQEKENSIIIATLQSEQVDIIRLDDMHAELMLLAIHQAFSHAHAEEFFQLLHSTTDFLMLYAIEIMDNLRFNYEQFNHESWKKNLFSHHLAILYCYDTEQGKKILSGAVIKTNADHLSISENDIVVRINEICPKLRSVKEKYELCQTFSKLIPTSGTMDEIDECLQPLRSFFLEKQATLDK